MLFKMQIHFAQILELLRQKGHLTLIILLSKDLLGNITSSERTMQGNS